MQQLSQLSPWNVLLVVLIVWAISWKGIALWRCGRNNQLSWFIAILVFNTAGLLEIIYLRYFQKDHNRA